MTTGRANAWDLAGIAIGDAVFLIISFTLIGVMMFVNIRVPHLLGSDRKAIPSFMRQALWTGTGAGLVAAAVCVAFGWLVQSVDMDPKARDVAVHFLFVIALTYPAIASFRALQGYMTSLGETRPTLILTIFGLASQLFLNWVFVFGNLGAPALGGVGCAVSSLIGWWLKYLALVIWMRSRGFYADTQPFTRFEMPDWREVWKSLTLGVPIGVSFLVEGSVFAVIAFLAAPLGSSELAAHQIAFNLSAFLVLLPASIGFGLTSRVGLAVGTGDMALARYRSLVGIGASVGIAVLAAMLLAAFRNEIAAIYTVNGAIADIAADLILILAIYHLAETIQTCFSAAIRAYSEVKAIMYIQLMAFWVIAIPLGGVLGLAPGWLPWTPMAPLGVIGLWDGLAVGLAVAAIGMTVLFFRVAGRGAEEALRDASA